MAMFNRVILVGRLCADPEVRATPDGLHVANLRLATNTYAGRDEAGKRKEHSDFHNVVLFGGLAEIAGSYLRKGRLVYAEGRLQHRTWEGQDGQKRHASEIVAETLQMLGPRADGVDDQAS
jgi:single-strand DNA-binding protein